MRTFVAVPVDGATDPALGALRERLASRLLHGGVAARVVPTANLHVTLKFLGETGEAQLADCAGALEAAAVSAPFEIVFDRLGGLPEPPKSPKVLCLRVGEGADRLQVLAEQVDRCYQRLGFERELRSYSPHLTLARIQGGAGRLGPVLGGLEVAGLRRAPVSEVVLYRSDTRPDGVRYVALTRVALRKE